jgi:hypothetical protein
MSQCDSTTGVVRIARPILQPFVREIIECEATKPSLDHYEPVGAHDGSRGRLLMRQHCIHLTCHHRNPTHPLGRGGDTHLRLKGCASLRVPEQLSAPVADTDGYVSHKGEVVDSLPQLIPGSRGGGGVRDWGGGVKQHWSACGAAENAQHEHAGRHCAASSHATRTQAGSL